MKNLVLRRKHRRISQLGYTSGNDYITHRIQVAKYANTYSGEKV